MPASRRSRVAQSVMSCVAELDACRTSGSRMPMIDLDELGLAVALDAGDAEHLAAVDRRSEMSSSSVRPALVDERRRPSSASSTSSVTVDSSVLGRGQLGADHQLGELRAW